MEGIVGENLENPLDYKKNALFQSLQVKAKNEIVDLANKKMQEAKLAGEKYTEDFRGYEIFIKTYFSFEFFAEHDLVGNSKAVFKDFKNYVEKQLEQIDKAKSYAQMSNIEKEIFDIEQ